MDEAQFTQRITQSRDKLFRISYTILHDEQDCAEALQEALLKAWIHLDRLREEQYFDTWLVRILINESKRLYSSRKTLALTHLPPSPPVADVDLHDALQALDEKMRLPVVLHYLEGYSLDEIAYLLKIPVGTVKSRMFAGRKKLRDILEREV